MLITIESNDERVTIDTAAALGRQPGPGVGRSAAATDLDAGPAGSDPGPAGGGVLDGGPFVA